ncbi:hypothetical protein HPP92_021035 [Vanilla planifolia]|uniref:C2H2-type domain-containing protein n=1 Tax=Vanilla planifolia TaxID=51239 RepID=A0A835PXD3_VANPL|nr:hypothetical protein HPP92_021035 [Vanilla planifolia]
MEKHTCKLCFRLFANGRALGGHMRSHVVFAAATVAVKSIVSDGSSSSSSSREFAAMVAKKGMGCGQGEIPKKRFRMADPEVSSTFAAFSSTDATSLVVQDHESETEPAPRTSAFNHRRSKRSVRSAAAPPPPELAEQEPLSSVSDTTPEEDVALSLMMLSRGEWTKDKEVEEQKLDLSIDQEMDRRVELAGKLSRATAKVRECNRFQCRICKKVFRSYQALGGHRASHKKSRGCAPPSSAANSRIHYGSISEFNAENRILHECPICFRVFISGQALGGHKRSHLSSSSITTTVISQPPPTLALVSKHSFDLNLPAPIEEHGELSAICDAEFVSSNLPSQ